jgi:murein DD-endopeptidase MepM/ murein hydrolase activator NlpD
MLCRQKILIAAVAASAAATLVAGTGSAAPREATTAGWREEAGQLKARSAGAHRTSFGSRSLRMGSRGKDVRYLQRSLTTLGFVTAVSGSFDFYTRKSVRRLERSKGWPVDGRVSKKDARRIAKLLTRKPKTVFFAYGLNPPAVTLTADRAGDASVDVTTTGGGVARIPVSFGGPGQQTVAWNGITAAGGYAPDGAYQMGLGDPGTAKASMVSGGQTLPFQFRQHAFPVPGSHSFGGAGSRFGAPRGDHLHQGQDVAAACGTGLVAAEGGILRVESYQASGAGYYVVIHGTVTGSDYVYMHLQSPSWALVGQVVYAGQQIARVGNTGSSSGCHLHFEHWTYPGWYLGGYPYDPLAELTYWDKYS